MTGDVPAELMEPVDERVREIALDILAGWKEATGLQGQTYVNACYRAFLDAYDRAVERHGEAEGKELAREAARRVCETGLYAFDVVKAGK